MSDVVVKVENLSKRYSLEPTGAGSGGFRHAIHDFALAPFRAFRKRDTNNNHLLAPDTRASHKDFWALKNVSFSVKSGEAVGIIGRNGAGKSTLLKILSRITEPTEGRAKIKGRVASLLEVGTGFHPELTGRENIFLNGAILGMSRAEIKGKFDEIVAFAEVDLFLDTPVKRYSSGMYVRLAFSVAAHLEPEILIVDEVLAVGDTSFQKKCLGKMGEVSRQHSRVVLFVSHNMQAVVRLCGRTILLDRGAVLQDGPSSEVVSSYLNSDLGTSAEREWADISTAPGNEIVRLCAVRVKTEDGKVSGTIDIRKSVAIEIEYEVLIPGHVLVPNFHFFNDEGITAFVSGDSSLTWRYRPRPSGVYVSTAWIPGNFLAEGTLIVGAAVSTMNPVVVHFYESNAVAFQAVDTMDGNSVRADYAGHIPGVVRPKFEWTTRSVAELAQREISIAEEKE